MGVGEGPGHRGGTGGTAIHAALHGDGRTGRDVLPCILNPPWSSSTPYGSLFTSRRQRRHGEQQQKQAQLPASTRPLRQIGWLRLIPWATVLPPAPPPALGRRSRLAAIRCDSHRPCCTAAPCCAQRFVHANGRPATASCPSPGPGQGDLLYLVWLRPFLLFSRFPVDQVAGSVLCRRDNPLNAASVDNARAMH